MFRTSLPADGGMLFVYDKPQIASFWMKNTPIPLDMIFIRADGSIDRIAENTIPESLEPVASGGDVGKATADVAKNALAKFEFEALIQGSVEILGVKARVKINCT